MRIRATYALARSLGAMLVGLGAGCDGGGSGGDPAVLGQNCGTFHACGGDPVGKWALRDLCYDDSLKQRPVEMFGPECADEVQSYVFHGAVTLTFERDGSLTSEEETFSATETLRFTQQCVDAILRSTGASQTVSIDDFCPSIESNYEQSGARASCHLSSAACSCTLTFDSGAHGSETSSYSVMGNQLLGLTMTNLVMGMEPAMGSSDGGVPDLSGGLPFCVQGDRLSMSLTSGDVTTTLVFGRQ